MKRINVVMIASCFGVTAFAGDTNFVAQYDAIWQTRNATNIYEFVEQAIATNKSPEAFFARGCVALDLQDWSIGASNYWEQSIQIISTNSIYTEIGRTNVVNRIRWLQGLFAQIEDNAPPSWNAASQAVIFSLPRTPSLYMLEEIAAIPLAENP